MLKQNGSGIRHSASQWGTIRGIAWIAWLTLLVCGLPQLALAEGILISAPGRVDMVYDDARDVLYITNGGTVLRYQLRPQSFLSPFQLGGQLKGLALSPDGNTLMVADQSYSPTEVWVHVIDLPSGQSQRVVFPRAFYEGGTFTVAFGGDGTALITSAFLGSGWVPLRKYIPATGEVVNLATITQDTMLSASADGSVIGFAESNISDGRFGRYRVADGDLLRKSGYTDGTAWFNYEIGVSRNGTQYAIPTYGGTFICDGNLVKYAIIGQYAAGQPIGVVYHPTQDIVYFAWATTTKVVAYDTVTLAPIAEYDVENYFDHPGNHAFVEGRLKLSQSGRLLFATVEGGVRAINLRNTPPTADPQSASGLEDRSVAITLTGSDAEADPLTYLVVDGPMHGTLSGAGPTLTYTPGANFNGSDQFAFKVTDGWAESSLATVSLSVSAVNDPPSFDLAGSTITVRHNSGPQTVSGWAVNISPGPSDEASQAVAFVVTNDASWLFTGPPAIDPAGTLTFAPSRGRKGTATVTVSARDNGSTANGGVDQSAPRSFTITVN